MKKVYIAGPYRADTEWGVKQNIDRAEAVALKYWKAGYAVFCPHKNSAFFGGACPDKTWLEGGLEFLKDCDAIVMVMGWADSIGSIREMEYAESHDIPIFHDLLSEPKDATAHFNMNAKEEMCFEDKLALDD